MHAHVDSRAWATLVDLVMERSVDLQQGDPDWDRVFQLARRGRVDALVARRVQGTAPEPWRRRFADALRRASFQSVWQARVQREVLEGLKAAGVGPIVLLKGAALGPLLYGDASLRPMNDLDVLVAPSQRPPAMAALTAIGFTPVATHPGRPASYAASPDWLLGRAEVPGRVNAAVELHATLGPPWRFPVDVAGVLARAVPMPDGSALRLGDTDLLVHLAIHLAKEQMGGTLKHLVDVHRFITQRAVAWDAVVDRARAWGARTALWLTLSLCQDALMTAVPEGVLGQLRPSPLVATWLKTAFGVTDHGLRRLDLPMRWSQLLFPIADSPRALSASIARYGRLRLQDLWLSHRPAVR